MPTLDDIRRMYPDTAGYSDHAIVQRLADLTGSSTGDIASLVGYKNTGGFMRDTGIDLAKGAIGVGQIATGAGNLATGGALGRGIRSAFGGDLEDVKGKLDQYYSDARQDANDAVANAHGFVDSAKAALTHPRYLLGGAIESAPAMLLPMGVGGKVADAVLSKGVQAAEGLGTTITREAAAKAASTAAERAGNAASSATWGGIAATQTADKINHELPNDPTAMYAGALGAGAAVGGITHGFSFLPGGHMADQAATTGQRMGLSIANQGSMMSTMGGAQTVAENAATGKPLDQGVAGAMGSGFVAGAGFGVMGGRERGENPAVTAGRAGDDAAAARAVADTDFQTQWNAWADQYKADQIAKQQAQAAAVQPTVDMATGVARQPAPNNQESMEAALNAPTSLWGQNPEDGHERNLTVGDLNEANQNPQAPVDPAAAQLAASSGQGPATPGAGAPVSDAERQAVFAKYGPAYPNVIEGKLNEHGEPLTVGQHFDGSKNPYLSPEKLGKAVEKLALADRDKQPGQLAAEQALADAFQVEMGRRPTSKEVTRLANEISLKDVTDKTTLVAHIDARLAAEEAKPKPDPTIVDGLTIWRKGVDPTAENHITPPADPVKVQTDEQGTVTPVQDPNAPAATQKAPAQGIVDVLQSLLTDMKSQGKDAVAYTDHNGKVRVANRNSMLQRWAALDGKERDRFNNLMGLDEEGHQVNNPMTHAQIAAAESAKYGREVTANAISNWAKDMGLSQEVVDKASAVHLELQDHDEFASPDSGLHVVDGAGDINKGGLGTQDMTGVERRQQQVANEFLAKNRSQPTAPEAPNPVAVEKNRRIAAEENRILGLKVAAESPYREKAIHEYTMLRRKGDPRFEELSDSNQAAWINAFDANARAVLHGHDDNLDYEFKQFIKEARREHAQRTETPADEPVRTAGEPGAQGDLGAPETRSESSAALRPLHDGASDADGQAVRQPVVAGKKKRTWSRDALEQDVAAAKGEPQVQEASGAHNPDVEHNRLTPIVAEKFTSATDAASWLRDNAATPALQMVAAKIAPYLKDVKFSVHNRGDMVETTLLNRFARGSMGLTVVRRDGQVEVHMLAQDVKANSMTHETLLHELVHAATMRRLENPEIRAEVSKLAAQVADTMSSNGDKFFSQKEIFGNPDEFMAYGLTSPTFQSWMKQMDASGRMRRDSGPRQQYVPQPTLWQKFVDVVRKMFGMAPAFKENIERALEANRQSAEMYKNDSLDTRMQALLDKTLATPERARPLAEKVAAASEHVASVSPAETRSAIEDNIKRLPPVLRKPVRGVMATIHDGAVKAIQASAFMHDLADWGAKHGLPAMQKVADVMAKRGAYKIDLDQALGKVVKAYQDLPVPEQDKVQQFMKDSTFEQRWGYQPSWRDTVKIDPEAKKQYDAMTPEAQKVADEAFRHNDQMRQDKQKALADVIQAHYTELASRAGDEDVAALWKKMEDEVKAVYKEPMEGPYAPLKRFGNQVVTVKSKALLDAKATDGAKYREMLDDPAHYRVEMHDGVYAAENRRAQLEDELGGSHVVERSEKEQHMPLGAGYETLSRLSEAMKARFDGEGYSEADNKVAAATYRAIQEAIIQSLGEHNARTSTLQRKYIAGVEASEMMRGFATQGYADNAFLTNMRHSRELNDHIAELRIQKDAGGDRTMKQQFFNELQARRAANLTADTPRWVGQAMRFTTLWKLVTSPAYYLQYLSQPLTMFLPLVQGDHGYGAGAKALAKATLDTKGIAKGLFDTDTSQLKDAGERKMLDALRAEGAIQIGHEQQFGRLQTMPERGFSKAWQKATDLVTTLPHAVEMHNRIASALAAYRLEMGKHGDAERATAYAKKAIYGAYGDYSSYNAPRIMQGGPITKLIMQYRQFQLIHTALLVRLMGNAFKDESPDVRRAAKLQLGYMAGHYGVLAGALGIPAAHVVAGALKGVFGDDNDKDIETFVNRHTGSKALADMILGGVPRAVFGQDLSSRMGAGDILSPFRYVNASDALTSRKGYQDTTIAAMGPFVGGLLPQMVQGVNQIGHGDYYRGMEQLMPKGVGDVMKAIRFADEGVIDKKGSTIVPQVSARDIVAQALGSRPTAISEPQHNAAVVTQIQQGFKDQANAIKSQFIRARKGGDDVSELVDKWKGLMDKQRAAGMKPDPLSELYKAPQQMGKRDRMMIDGVPYRKTTRGLVQDVVGVRDE